MTALTPEQRAFAEENHGLIFFVLERNGWSIDEYYGDAAIGLCKAVVGYDVKRGTEFSSYAVKVIKNEILQQFRKARAMKRRNCVEVPIDYHCVYADPCTEPETAYLMKEHLKEIKAIRE